MVVAHEFEKHPYSFNVYSLHIKTIPIQSTKTMSVHILFSYIAHLYFRYQNKHASILHLINLIYDIIKRKICLGNKTPCACRNMTR